MPKNITIRDIPDEVYDKLKQQAELHRRSVNSEVIVYLERMVSSTKPDADQIIKRAKNLKKSAQGRLSIDEIQKQIDIGRP